MKTAYNNILVGIVDRRKQKKFRKSSNSDNAICYFGQKGLIVYGNIN